MFKRNNTAKVSGIAVAAGGAIAATVFSMLPAGAAAAASQPNSGAWGLAIDGQYSVPEQAAVTSTGANGTGARGGVQMGSYLDGKVLVDSITTSATPYHASSQVTGLSLNGQVTVTNARATCDNGKVSGTGTVVGTPTDGTTVKVLKGVTARNSDGSNSVVGLLITATAPNGQTETIRVAAATCGAKAATTPPTTTPPTTAPPTTSAPTTPPATTAPTTSAPSEPPSTTAPTSSAPSAPATSNPPAAPAPIAPAPIAQNTHLPVTG